MSLKKQAISLSLKSLTVLVLGFASSLLSANTAEEASNKEGTKVESILESTSSYFARFTYQVVDSVSSKTESLINEAMQLIGVRYRWNGDLPQSGLDASGFVRFVLWLYVY